MIQISIALKRLFCVSAIINSPLGSSTTSDGKHRDLLSPPKLFEVPATTHFSLFSSTESSRRILWLHVSTRSWPRKERGHLICSGLCPLSAFFGKYNDSALCSNRDKRLCSASMIINPVSSAAIHTGFLIAEGSTTEE